jgi:hypothetical protein
MAGTFDLVTRDTSTAPAHTFELPVVEADGNTYVARITGSRIAQDHYVAAYLTDDDLVVAYDERSKRYHVADDPAAELRRWLRHDAYVEAMHALGLEPRRRRFVRRARVPR